MQLKKLRVQAGETSFREGKIVLVVVVAIREIAIARKREEKRGKG